MRIPFCSLTFATQASARLSTLLPALSWGQAKDWTAQVYGYADWNELKSEVAKVDVPVLRNLEPNAKFAVDAYQAGREGNGSDGRTEFQIQKVEELLGWSRQAAETLYVTWEPRRSGSIRVARLADLGPGSPAFQLMQTNVVEPLDTDGGLPVIAGFEGGAGRVYLGFPGTAAERQAAIAEFLVKLPTSTSLFDGSVLASFLGEELRESPSVQAYGSEGTFAQVHPMTFFAFLECESESREIIGAGAVTFALVASRDDSHHVKITLEHLALLPHEELRYAMSESIAVAVWEAVVRYLWATVGNSNRKARIVVEYLADNVADAECALEAYAQIVEFCAVSNRPGQATDEDVRFELSGVR